MAKVCIHALAEWEGRWIVVQRVVRLRGVIDWKSLQPSEELIDVARALDRPERVAVSSVVVFLKVLRRMASLASVY